MRYKYIYIYIYIYTHIYIYTYIYTYIDIYGLLARRPDGLKPDSQTLTWTAVEELNLDYHIVGIYNMYVYTFIYLL